MPRGKSTYRTVTVAGKKSFTVCFQNEKNETEREEFGSVADTKSFIRALRRFNKTAEYRILKTVTKEIRWEPK